MSKRRESRHKQLLKDPDVRRWHENLARGSQVTADNFLRVLGLFLEQNGLTPKAFARMGTKKRDDLLSDHIAKMQQEGKAGSYAGVVKKAAVSWLDHNGKRLGRRIKIDGLQATPTLSEERVPTQEELRRVFLAATPRDRVSCALVAHAGLRPEVIGNYRGDDGLRVRDLPELEVRGTEVEFQAIPTIVIVRPELSKTGQRYFTFLGEEACGYLKGYLESRLRAGDKLGSDADLVSPARASKRFIRSTNISDGIRRAIRSGGFSWRPYVLRAYFDTQLLLAESKGNVAHDYRVFWMGHKGSMEARYTTNKGRLPPQMVEDMREAYRRCESFLATAPSESHRDAEAEIAKVMLVGLGYTEDELVSTDFSQMTPEDFQHLVRKKMTTGEGPSGRQKIVTVEEIAGYLERGWSVAMPMNHTHAILNPPPFG